MHIPLEENLIAQRAEEQLFGNVTTLGRYRITGELGRGGWAVVYAAYDPLLDREVAIKLLRADHEQSPEALARAGREARVLARFHHPHIVPIYEAWEQEGRLCIVMQRVQGEDLRAWSARTPRSTQDIVRIIVDAARGLAEAHRRGVVHRDVKAENILVEDSGQARVADFGLASGTSLTAAKSLDQAAFGTGASTTIGTAAYAAPEQLAGNPADPRSDQFSLALTLAEALGFEPDEARRGLWRLSEHRASPPRALMSIVQRALAIRPEQRYPSMEAFAAALEQMPSARGRRLMALAVLLLAGSALLARPPTASRDGSQEPDLPISAVQLQAVTQSDPATAASILLALKRHYRRPWWRRLAHTVLLAPRPGPVLEVRRGVRDLRAHPAGTGLFVADYEGNIEYRDLVASPSQAHHLVRFPEVAATVDLSEDGSRALAGSYEGRILVWDVDFLHRAPIEIVVAHPLALARFDSAGRRVVAAGSDGSASIYTPGQGTATALPADRGRGKPVLIVPDAAPKVVFDKGEIMRVSGERWSTLRPRGDVEIASATSCRATGDIVLASADGSLVLVRDEVDIRADGLGGTQMACSRDGQMLAVARADHAALIDLSTLAEIRRLPGARLGKLGFSNDDDWLFGSAGKHAVALRVDGTGDMRTFVGHDDDITALVPEASGRWLISGSEDGTIRTFHQHRFHEPQLIRPPIGDLEGSIPMVNFEVDPDERRVAVATGACASLWSVSPRVEKLRELYCSETPQKIVWTARWNPDGTKIVVGSNEGKARVLHLDDARPPETFLHPAEVRDARFHPTRELIATACDDGLVRLHRLDQPAEARLLVGHEKSMMGEVQFSPDGEFVASRSIDLTVRVWAVDTGEPRAVLHHDAPSESILFTGDSRFLLSAADDGVLRSWDTKTGRTTELLHLSDRSLRGVTLCGPLGVAVGRKNGMATILFPGLLNSKVELRGHQADVRRVACSDNGLIATASYDDQAFVWELEHTEAPLLSLPHGDNVWSSTFLDRGNRLLTASAEPMLRLVDIVQDPERLLTLLEEWHHACPSAELFAQRTVLPSAQVTQLRDECLANTAERR